ncbi:uncharacterized protein LOC118505818 [Anopheles stephensi]|uniref:Uncharacterized protein n=1 Tax=Anopheles stephensi TaxID=30069 RepID=A0A182Y625_ANOST|nr:uncharacterized protein LOC118505818 [Anopheles stephensi]
MEPDRGIAAVMSFKCPLCDMPIESQEKLKQHIKVTHSHYYYDTYLFPPEMLFPGASSSATANVEGVISHEPLSTQEVTIEQAEEECCTCCAYEESGQGGDCGFCDCEDDAQGECDDCLVM